MSDASAMTAQRLGLIAELKHRRVFRTLALSAVLAIYLLLI